MQKPYNTTEHEQLKVFLPHVDKPFAVLGMDHLALGKLQERDGMPSLQVAHETPPPLLPLGSIPFLQSPCFSCGWEWCHCSV